MIRLSHGPPVAPLSCMPFSRSHLPSRVTRGVALAALLASTLLSGGVTHADDAAPPDNSPAPAVAAPAPTSQFGVIVSNPASNDYVSYLLNQLGMTSWYDFSPPDEAVDPPGLARVRLLRTGDRATGMTDADLAAMVAVHPGEAWMIGNEPNTPGQDNTPPDVYAQTLHDWAGVIRATDPTATIVGPNVLNWDSTCTGCPGYTPGHAWTDAFLAAYQDQFGATPPLDVWGIHAYDIDWQNLPMGNATPAEADLQSVSAYLNGTPGLASLPIWVTEFGVIWGFDGIGSQTVNGNLVAVPTGAYREDHVDSYIADFTTWLRTSGADLGIQRSFLYATNPPPEPFATRSAGIALFDGPGIGANLTASGQAYAQAATGNLTASGDPAADDQTAAASADAGGS